MKIGLLKKLEIEIEKQTATEDQKFQPGKTYTEGSVQRHILGLHDEFADSWRICGDFLCIEIDPQDVDDSNYDIDQEKVKEYTKRLWTEPNTPPIVLNFEGDIIDGGHRHAAAKLLGTSILALVQIEDSQEDPDEES